MDALAGLELHVLELEFVGGHRRGRRHAQQVAHFFQARPQLAVALPAGSLRRGSTIEEWGSRPFYCGGHQHVVIPFKKLRSVIAFALIDCVFFYLHQSMEWIMSID